MKIVFINRYFYPDHSATSQLLTDLAVHLAARGHEIHVICSRQLYEGAGAHLCRRETVSGVQIHRAWSTSFGRMRLAGRLLDYATFYVGSLFTLLRLCDPPTIVVAKTDPPLISVLAAGVVRIRRARLVNWLQDVFPEVGEHLGIRVLGGRVGRWIKRLRDASLRAAACNVVLGERMAMLVQACGVAQHRTRVIANWSDAEAVDSVPKEDNPLLTEWELQGKFVVMYSGNMGRAHEFETMLDAASLLAEDPRIVFLFAGGGAKRSAVQVEVQRRGLTNVLFKPYQPKERLGASLSAGDVHLISLLPELEGLIVPSKFYGVLAAGRPSLFIGDRDGELARLIGRYQVGRTVEIGDARGLVEAIRDYSAQNSPRQDGLRARQLLLDHFQRTLALAMWEDVLVGLDASTIACTGNGSRVQ